ncbi:ABC transporter substrate-binding protein, partial [Escherichia sp. SS-MK2]
TIKQHNDAQPKPERRCGDSGNGHYSQQMRGPIPEGMWGYDATAMQYNHDETKAKAEWDKVTSKPTSLTFLYSDNDPNWEPIALATQSSLNKLGINVKLEKLANATMRDRVGKGDYDIAIGNWSPDRYRSRETSGWWVCSS